MPERYLGRNLGRFRIDSIIGSGGFAWVYKGYDPELDIPIAIKVLKPQYAGEETFEGRFRREASTAAKLRHPNIIRILAVGREEQAVYFVMDYLPTGLDDRLRIMGTLPETLLIRMGMDIAAALAFAHREGVIHRDVKTDNILFDEHGNAIVADFGIARAVSGYVEQTGTNMVVGTPQYFSPEQARGQQLDGRADIYSLGVTLFKAATGVLPFQGDDWYDIARQHVEEQPPKPRAFNPALSRGIERVILKCLEKDPANRYPTGDALHTELVQLLGKASTPDGDTTVVMPTPVGAGAIAPSAMAPGARRPETHRWPVMIAALATATALALVGATLHRRTPGTAATRSAASAASDPAARGADAPPLASSAAPGAAATDDGAAPGAATPSDDFGSRAPALTLAGAAPTDPAANRRPELRVDVPDGAAVIVDGHTVARGGWRSRDIAVGMHTIAAAVHTVTGCPTARASRTVRVDRGDPTIVALAPRPCGFLALDAEPAGAHWQLRTTDGDLVAQGTTPVGKPLLLPVGTYRLRVSSRFCADYQSSILLPETRVHRERVRLICG